jgi:pilus assembly protein CpaE
MTIYLLTSEPHKKSSGQIEAIETRLATLVPEIRKIKRIEDVAAEISGNSTAKVVVVFVSPSLAGDGINNIISIAQRYRHRVFFILVSNEISGTDYKRLIRSGGAEWVAAGGSLQEIPELIHRQNFSPEPESRSQPDGRPTIISFLPSLGGVGNTTIALDVALRIKLAKATRTRKICYIDLDFQTSHVCDYLDIDARLQLHDILDRPERLDEQLFELFVSHHRSGLDVFASPRSKLDPCDVDADALDPLLEMILSRYDLVVLDLPVTWYSWSRPVLANSNAIMLTGINTVPCLRQMRSTLDEVLKAKTSSTQLAIVMNRVARHLLGGVERRGHVEKVFPGENIFYIGENRRAIDRVNTGTPAALAGNHAKDFAKLTSFCAGLKQTAGREAAR